MKDRSRFGMRGPTLRILILAFAGLLAIACSSDVPGRDKPAANDQEDVIDSRFDGGTWLKWDKSSRAAFILGGVAGYLEGRAGGCFEARRQFQSLPGVTGITQELASQVRKAAA